MSWPRCAWLLLSYFPFPFPSAFLPRFPCSLFPSELLFLNAHAVWFVWDDVKLWIRVHPFSGGNSFFDPRCCKNDSCVGKKGVSDKPYWVDTVQRNFPLNPVGCSTRCPPAPRPCWDAAVARRTRPRGASSSAPSSSPQSTTFRGQEFVLSQRVIRRHPLRCKAFQELIFGSSNVSDRGHCMHRM